MSPSNHIFSIVCSCSWRRLIARQIQHGIKINPNIHAHAEITIITPTDILQIIYILTILFETVHLRWKQNKNFCKVLYYYVFSITIR